MFFQASGYEISHFVTNDMFSQASGYEISPFGRNDRAGAGRVGGRVGREAPDPSSQNQPVNAVISTKTRSEA